MQGVFNMQSKDIIKDENQNQYVKEQAIKFIELGLLRMLYIKGILSEEEYDGIRKVAEEQK